jgi:hypothetical protein
LHHAAVQNALILKAPKVACYKRIAIIKFVRHFPGSEAVGSSVYNRNSVLLGGFIASLQTYDQDEEGNVGWLLLSSQATRAKRQA